jgi:hypothetical protein
MDPQLLGTATAFGLASSVGLNTTLPLLLVGLLTRFGLVELTPPYDALGSFVTLVGLAVLAATEFVADKVPALDTVVQVLQWPAAAVAGAILFASQTSVIRSVSPELAILVGVVTSGAVHGARTAARPLITGLTGGLGNPAVSATEDAGAVSLAGAVVATLLQRILTDTWA